MKIFATLVATFFIVLLALVFTGTYETVLPKVVQTEKMQQFCEKNGGVSSVHFKDVFTDWRIETVECGNGMVCQLPVADSRKTQNGLYIFNATDFLGDHSPDEILQSKKTKLLPEYNFQTVGELNLLLRIFNDALRVTGNQSEGMRVLYHHNGMILNDVNLDSQFDQFITFPKETPINTAIQQLQCSVVSR